MLRNWSLTPGKTIALGLLAALLLTCQTHVPLSIRFPYEWLGSPGFGGDIDLDEFPEPSGICWHPSRKTLFVVSDEGWVEEIRRNGQRLSLARVPGDLEAIAADPSSGLLYIVVEGEDVILEFDPEKKGVTRRFPVDRSFRGDPNFLQKQVGSYDNGIESLAFVPNPGHAEGGTFYSGNQWDPSCLLELLVPLRSSGAAGGQTRILRVLTSRLDDPSGMYYDGKARLLNVVSDADNILYEVSLDGKIVREYAFPGDGQEGIARDEEGFLYVAQDSGGILKIKDLRNR